MYRIIPDAEVVGQVAALPVEALEPLAELLERLELLPWTGDPQHADNPDGSVRRAVFGRDGLGHLVYLVVDHVDEVHLLRVQWLG